MPRPAPFIDWNAQKNHYAKLVAWAGVRVGSIKRDRLGAGAQGLVQPQAERGWHTQATRRLVKPFLKVHYRGFINCIGKISPRDLDVDQQFQPPRPLARVFFKQLLYGRYRAEMDREHSAPGLHTRREHEYHAKRNDLACA